jgi:hypothetical protein
VSIRAARTIINMHGYQGHKNSKAILGQYTAPKDYCPFEDRAPYCDYAYPYRMSDGTCNNMLYPNWGKSRSPLKRLLPPAYEDLLDGPRALSYTGRRKLPSPRRIAIELHHPRDLNDHVTSLFVHYSQFIDHDITLTGLTSDEEGRPIKCFCSNKDYDCLNINVPSDDEVNKDQRCFVTPRSTAAPHNYNCRLGAREQLNMLTHWLDLSNVYGNNLASGIGLRLLSQGLLNSSMIKNIKREYLPFTMDGSCSSIPAGKPCFLSGDIRTNQNTILLTVQTIWLREHNRVAKALAEFNPYWSDEKLFQEARR